MSSQSKVETPDQVSTLLNRVVELLGRSLTSYLLDAPPWWSRQDETLSGLLPQIVEDQRRTLDRVVPLIQEQGAAVQFGAYPVSYTALNDLVAPFVAERLVSHQSFVVEQLELIAGQLPPGSVAAAVIQEALGAAKAHLDQLRAWQQAHTTTAG